MGQSIYLLFIILFAASLNLPANRSTHQTKPGEDQLFNQIDSLLQVKPDSAAAFIDSLQKNLKNPSTKISVLFLNSKATFWGLKGENEKALDYYQRAIDLAQTAKDSISLAQSYQSRANYYSKNFQLKKAIEDLLNAQKYLRSNESDLQFNIINSLAVTHKRLKNYKIALNYFQQLEQEYKGKLTQQQAFQLYTNLGSLSATQRDYNKAKTYFLNAYQTLDTLNANANLAMTCYNLGTLFLKLDNYQKSNDYVKRALKIYMKLQNKDFIARCYLLIGSNYIITNENKSALIYLKKSLAISKEINNPRLILSNYKNIAITEEGWSESFPENTAAQHLRKSIAYFKQWAATKDSLYQSENTAKILELEKQYQTKEKNIQIANLEKENQFKQHELDIKIQQHRLLFTLFLIITVGIVIAFYLVFYFRRLQRHTLKLNKQVNDQKDHITVQNELLQKSIDSQNKLFSILAHDLRSPLVSLSNFTRLINHYLDAGEIDEVRNMAIQLEQKNEQVLDLTDNLLNWARSQWGGLKVLLTPVAPDELIKHCANVYQGVADDKLIKIEVEKAEECVIWADKNMMETILRNIINNAIKFTPENGKIYLAVSTKTNYAQITIRDTGVGMTEEQRKNLFTPEASHSEGTNHERSTGLGLIVCKEFTEKLNGNIKVTSILREGTTFWIEIPLFNPEIHHYTSQQKGKRKRSGIF